MSKKIVLILEDIIEETVDEYGHIVSLDKTFGTDEILRDLRQHLGDPLDIKSHKNESLSKKSYSFGGHEVISTSIEILYALAGTGVIAGSFSVLKEWVKAKSNRRLKIETLQTESGKKTVIDATGYSKTEIESLLSDD